MTGPLLIEKARTLHNLAWNRSDLWDTLGMKVHSLWYIWLDCCCLREKGTMGGRLGVSCGADAQNIDISFIKRI